MSLPDETPIETAGQKLESALAESNSELAAAQAGEVAKVDQQIEEHAVAIDVAKARTVRSILDIGRHLQAVHDVLVGTGRDGAFAPWVAKRCGFSKRSAYNYLEAHDVFGEKCATVARFFSARAIYLLSSASCPRNARAAAVSLAKGGEHVNCKKAKELRDKYAPTSDKQDERYDFDTAMEKLREAVGRVRKRWLEGQDDVLPQIIHAIGDDIEREEAGSQPAKATTRPRRTDHRLFNNYLDLLKALREATAELVNSKVGSAIDKPDVMRLIRQIKKHVEENKACCPCPYCSRKGCMVCRETRVVSKCVAEQATDGTSTEEHAA